MSQDVYAAYIGIDWSDRKHDIYLYDCITGETEESVIGSQPDAIAAWVEGLRKRYGFAMLAVCLEQKRGPLVYALCQYENLVLFPINPRTVSNYRKAFQPSRAKSDPIDARILVELLRKHGQDLRTDYEKPSGCTIFGGAERPQKSYNCVSPAWRQITRMAT